MQIRWSLPATEDLERICAWIERDNPEAARRIAKIIYSGCAQLKAFPNMGRTSRRMSGRRELAFPPLPYIAVYQVNEHAVEISRIFSRSAGLAFGLLLKNSPRIE
ncbi:MAG: type II toxin-antitoxin system RelE/ParE family toxin [Bryobacteraceae bacterium]